MGGTSLGVVAVMILAEGDLRPLCAELGATAPWRGNKHAERLAAYNLSFNSERPSLADIEALQACLPVRAR